MIFTVVYVTDDGAPYCYGQFSTHAAAERFKRKLDGELDSARDPAGGGAGIVSVCQIRRRVDWET